jgi:hypothetical protein
MNLTSIFTYDRRNRYIDLQPSVMYAVAGLLVLGWTILQRPTGDPILFFVSILLFFEFVCLLLRRLGATRIGCLAALVLLTLVLGNLNLTGKQFIELAFYTGTATFFNEYFRNPSQYAVFLLGVVLGLVGWALHPHTTLYAATFTLILLSWIVWHKVFDSVSKIAFIKDIFKACLGGVIALGIYLIANTFYKADRFTIPFAPAHHPSLIVTIIIALLFLRGLWATALIPTTKSPQFRHVRLFWGFAGVLSLAIVLYLHEYAARIFQTHVATRLQMDGLTTVSLETLIPCLVFIAITTIVGVDRSFLTRFRIGRTLARKMHVHIDNKVKLETDKSEN